MEHNNSYMANMTHDTATLPGRSPPERLRRLLDPIGPQSSAPSRLRWRCDALLVKGRRLGRASWRRSTGGGGAVAARGAERGGLGDRGLRRSVMVEAGGGPPRRRSLEARGSDQFLRARSALLGVFGPTWSSCNRSLLCCSDWRLRGLLVLLE